MKVVKIFIGKRMAVSELPKRGNKLIITFGWLVKKITIMQRQLSQDDVPSSSQLTVLCRLLTSWNIRH